MSLLIDQHTKNSYTYVKTFLQILIHVIHSLKVILSLKVKMHLYILIKNKIHVIQKKYSFKTEDYSIT